MNSQQYHQQVANEIIEMIKAGSAPWQKCWESGDLPMNGNTRRRYRGMNAIYLYKRMQDKGYQDSRWYTFKQINALGGKIKKGEKGTPVEFWKFTEIYKDKNGEEKEVPLDRPQAFRHMVFNAEQATGIPEYKKQEFQWDPIERAEKLLEAVGTPIYHDQLDQNYYNSRTDSIHLTPKTSFINEEAYYSTALHELGHSTGHESRLNRPLGNSFGSPEYAREELRAEIASFMLCKDLGLEEDPKHKEQHASYVDSWIQALEKDHNEIFRAAADAERICDYIYGREKLLEKEQDKDLSLAMEEPETFGAEAQEAKKTLAATEQKPVAAEKTGPAVDPAQGKAEQAKAEPKKEDKIDATIKAEKELAGITQKVTKIVERMENAFAKMGTLLNGKKNAEQEATEKAQPEEKAAPAAAAPTKEQEAKEQQTKAREEKQETKEAPVEGPTARQVYFLKQHQLEVPPSKVMASVVIGREIKLNEIRSFVEPQTGKMTVLDAYHSLAKKSLEETKGINDTEIAKDLFKRGFGKNDVQRAIYSCSPANSHSNALSSTKAAMEELKKENFKFAGQERER